MKGQRKHIEILQALGVGPRGELARARAEGISRECALKTFFPDIWARKKDRQRFVEDSEVLATISSPHIAKVYSVGERGNEVHLLREMVEGIPLDLAFFHRVEMPPATVLTVAQRIGEGLREAHRIGITHCNLRLSNVILQPNGKLKLTDFALPPPPQVGEKVSGPIAELTAYLSPEQLVGGAAVDERTDLFSLGVILYNLLTLDRPFWGRDSGDIRNSILTDLPKSFEESAGVDPKLQLIVLKCLHKNVEERYQSFSALERDILASSEPKPAPLTPELFQGIAIRCGLEKVFPAAAEAAPPAVKEPKAPPLPVSLRPPRPEPEVVRPGVVAPQPEAPVPEEPPAEEEPKVEAPPAKIEGKVAPPAKRETAPSEPEPIPEPEAIAPEPVAAEAEEETLPKPGAPPAPPPYELSRKVVRRERTPEEVIQRYIRAWNTRAFLIEYSCFARDFLKASRREYVDRRMVTYLKLTRQGQVTQDVEKVLRVERRSDEATVLCARRLEFPRRTELYLDYYTLKREEGEWKICDVRSRRTTRDEITRVVDHELMFIGRESTG